MIQTVLKSPSESVSMIASLFASANKAKKPVFLSVREDVCFGNGWLNLGKISLKAATNGKDDNEYDIYENAVTFGFYEWHTNNYQDIYSQCDAIIKFNPKQNKNLEKTKEKTRRAMESIIDVSMRLGLCFPCFDPDMICVMPFRRPTTVIADTSAISRGGVDFLVRFLYPTARLKIPAVVSMEISNQSDNFFAKRRHFRPNDDKPSQKADILLDHVVSQAHQRALFRFELHSDIEIERTSIFSDPLRNAFQRDKEANQDWQELNVSAPIRSYCDRLILETVRQHLSIVMPGHPVMLMTGDEGLARMALAEGILPLFFHAGRRTEMYGHTLTGTRFHPFTGEVFSSPLQDLLWEFAVTFGNARLATEDESLSFEVCAIDKDMNWQPFHAKEDLLRVSWNGFSLEQPEQQKIQSLSFSISKRTPNDRDVLFLQPEEEQITSIQSTPKLGTFKPDTIYRFSLKVLMEFIYSLITKGSVSITGNEIPLQMKATKTRSRYLRFLENGKFITKAENSIQPTENLRQLWDAFIRLDLESATKFFRKVNSLNKFLDQLKIENRIEIDLNLPESERPSPAYLQIAELCGLAIQIPRRGVYGTFHNPKVRKFADLAYQVYKCLRKGDDYILTGEWLERLACEHGVHPLTARKRLAEAQEAGLLERYTQGSTPDTRFENHTLSVLQVDGGRPTVTKVCLYHGGFIIPGKASVSIRLEKK